MQRTGSGSGWNVIGQPALPYLLAAGGFSLAVNLLYLAAPLYMLQVYNRVVTSGSITTLVVLTAILLFAYAVLSLLDSLRSRILGRLGIRLEEVLSERILQAALAAPAASRGQVVRDFEQVRQFTASGALLPIFDLVWTPVYIVTAFLLHPLLGAFTLAGALLLVGLAIANEWLLAGPTRKAGEAGNRAQQFAEMSLRNSEVIAALGMRGSIGTRWREDRAEAVALGARAAETGAILGGLIKFLRLSMQSVVLGLGALLAVERLVSPGAMFASTFLLGRALQPIEQIVGGWRGMVLARAALRRLLANLAALPAQKSQMSLPSPTGRLAVESLSYAPERAERWILRNVSFSVESGESVGIIGPSSAGKSTLSRLLVGVLSPSQGSIRLDGATLDSWAPGALGPHIGYLPQDVELFADTVANNISRMQHGTAEAIISAARIAGVHDIILRLPQGYNTAIGEGGVMLSGGIRQRIALARAIYGQPRIVVLDEPSSNLDQDGDRALAACLGMLKQLGTTVFIVSHRPASIATVDKILLLRDGAVENFGPRDQVLARVLPSTVTPIRPSMEAMNG